MAVDEPPIKEADRLDETPITTVQATAENFPEKEILKLMRQFCADTFNPIGEFKESTRGRIMAALEQTSDETLMADGLKPADNRGDVDEQEIFQEFTKELQRNVRQMRRLIAEGNVQIIIKGEEVIAAVGARNVGKMEDGRDVYEFTEAIVMPPYRGHKLSILLTGSLLFRGISENPNAPFMCVTEKDAIIKGCKTYGWKEKDLDYFKNIILRKPGIDQALRDYIEKWYDDKKTKPAWKGFIYDPLAPVHTH